MLRLALSYAEGGKIEEACSTADAALQLGAAVESYRFEEVKGDLAHVLRAHQRSTYSKTFEDRHAILRNDTLPRSTLSERRF